VVEMEQLMLGRYIETKESLFRHSRMDPKKLLVQSILNIRVRRVGIGMSLSLLDFKSEETLPMLT